MMDEMNRAPVPSELVSCPACREATKGLQGIKGLHHSTTGCRLQEQKQAELRESLLAELAEVKEDRDLDRMEAAITARLQSQKQSQQARSVVRTRPLMVPKLQPVGRGRGRR